VARLMVFNSYTTTYILIAARLRLPGATATPYFAALRDITRACVLRSHRSISLVRCENLLLESSTTSGLKSVESSVIWR
jgi:hypothetical protein